MERRRKKETRGEKKGKGKKGKEKKNEEGEKKVVRTRNLQLYRYRLSPQGRIAGTIYPLQISILMT